jgi:hypothetical protein
MYEMQGTLPGLAAWASQLPGLPVPRAARQSQEPARGSGFPTPPTSRSCLRAVPVSNGESISTALARDHASPLPHHFPVISLSTPLSTERVRLSAFNVGFPPPNAQSVHRLPGVTRRTPYCRIGRRGRHRRNPAGAILDFPRLRYAVPEMMWRHYLRSDPDTPLRGEIAAGQLGPVSVGWVKTSTPHSVYRTPGLIRRDSPELYRVALATSGRACLRQDGRSARLSLAGRLL